jgi:hypothetical protein
VADDDTDMSPEAQEFMKALDVFLPLLSAANKWDYLPVLRWFDVFGVRNKILAAVSASDAFLRRLIDAERRRLQEGEGGDNDEKKSMIDWRSALIAEVGAGGVHGYHDHGSVLAE